MRARSTSLAGSDLDAPRCSSSTRSASESCMILTRLAIATLSHTLHHYTRELRDSPLASSVSKVHATHRWAAHGGGQMQAAMRHAHDRSRELERIISFSDGVFSIVITLLVLPITAEVEPLQAGDGFAAEVWALWP